MGMYRGGMPPTFYPVLSPDREGALLDKLGCLACSFVSLGFLSLGEHIQAEHLDDATLRGELRSRLDLAIDGGRSARLAWDADVQRVTVMLAAATDAWDRAHVQE